MNGFERDREYIAAERAWHMALLEGKPAEEIARLKAEKDRLWDEMLNTDKADAKRERTEYMRLMAKHTAVDRLGPGCHH